jgi:zinc transporter
LEISIKSYSDGYGYPFLRRRNFLDSGGGSTALGQMRKSTKRVNPLEERLLAKRVSVSRTELGSLRRMLVRLQRLLAPEQTAFFRLLSRPPHWIKEEELQNLHQAAEKFSIAISDTAALVERVKQLQEELAALVNEQTNRTLFVLTIVTVLALPINFVAGLFA